MGFIVIITTNGTRHFFAKPMVLMPSLHHCVFFNWIKSMLTSFKDKRLNAKVNWMNTKIKKS